MTQRSPSIAEIRAFQDDWQENTGERPTRAVAEVLMDREAEARYQIEASGGNEMPAIEICYDWCPDYDGAQMMNYCLSCGQPFGSTHEEPIGILQGPVIPTDECPEYCGHTVGRCLVESRAIQAAEIYAEGGYDRMMEQGYPGYDFDPNDPRATGW